MTQEALWGSLWGSLVLVIVRLLVIIIFMVGPTRVLWPRITLIYCTHIAPYVALFKSGSDWITVTHSVWRVIKSSDDLQ